MMIFYLTERCKHQVEEVALSLLLVDKPTDWKWKPIGVYLYTAPFSKRNSRQTESHFLCFFLFWALLVLNNTRKLWRRDEKGGEKRYAPSTYVLNSSTFFAAHIILDVTSLDDFFFSFFLPLSFIRRLGLSTSIASVPNIFFLSVTTFLFVRKQELCTIFHLVCMCKSVSNSQCSIDQ